MDDSHLQMQESHQASMNQYLGLSAKKNLTQGKKICESIVHCTYCSMQKGTSQAEAMSNSEKIKPVALAVI